MEMISEKDFLVLKVNEVKKVSAKVVKKVVKK